jgi:hypothetical protein
MSSSNMSLLFTAKVMALLTKEENCTDCEEYNACAAYTYSTFVLVVRFVDNDTKFGAAVVAVVISDTEACAVVAAVLVNRVDDGPCSWEVTSNDRSRFLYTRVIGL